MAYDLRVKRVARKPDAFVPKQVFRTAPGTYTGADAQQRKVTGASAEVSDENQFVLLQRGLVVVGGAHGLVLKRDMLVAGAMQRILQAELCEAILVVTFRTHKADRAANYDMCHASLKLTLGSFPQIAQDIGDQIFQQHLPAKYLCTAKGTAGEE